MQDNSYRLVIKTRVNGQETIIEFDTVNPPSVSGSSQLTEQPMVNGDIISDHMYKEPITVTLTGSFSIYGNKPTVFRGKGDRLTNVQDTFEKIKDEGVFCTLVTLRRDRNSKQRYKSRQNMVLKSFTWTEGQSTVDFSFTFQQVLLANLNVAIPVYDVNDKRLPDLTDATMLNFTEELIDYKDVVKAVVSELVAHDLINNYTKFLQGVASYALENLPVEKTTEEKQQERVNREYIGFGAVTAILGPVGSIGYGLGMLLNMALHKDSVGLVDTVVSTVEDCVDKYTTTKYQTKPFNYIEGNDEYNQSEYKRFADYIGQIQLNLEECIGNNNMKLYGCSENKPQACIIYIDDDYYTFTFTINNTNQNVNLKITNTDDVELFNKEVRPLRGLGDCISSNRVLLTKSGYEVYILNPYLYELEDKWASEEEYRLAQQDISKYRVLVSTKNVSDLVNNLKDIIIENMIGD